MGNICNQVLSATFIHAPVRGTIDIVKNALISVDADGVISSMVTPDDARYQQSYYEAKSARKLVELPRTQYLLPGFVDLHIHAPQWPQLGKALDVPLEVWLQKHTFPLEARYQDEEFAARVYADLVASLLANGTTTGLYFATIHQQATRILADTCLKFGQRAVIGKVAMDNHAECPDYYRDQDAETSIEGTASFIDYVKSMAGNEAGLVRPAITPRFIPSCTDEALTGLGNLVQKTGCHVQTHCSESDWEHNYVLSRFGKTDTNALNDFGLLHRTTVLAHGNFLSSHDMDVIRDKGASVAHCPLSNYFFSNATFPLRRALEKGVRVGLGTDISGGPSASMFDACRHAVTAARALDEGIDANKAAQERGVANSRIDFREAFHLATAGGAEALDLKCGRFASGYHFDAFIVDTSAETAPIFVDDDTDTLEDIAQKIVMLATRANIKQTWVSGRKYSGSGGLCDNAD